MVAGILLTLSGIAASASDSSRDSSTTTSSTSSTTTTLVATTTTTQPPSVNPFTVQAVAAYLKNRTNLVTAAVSLVR